MKHFLIAANSIKDENLLLTSKIEEYISMHGGSSRRIIGDLEGTVAYKVDGSEAFDCVIALGGDGTILNVSRDLRKMNLPIVGVNLGTLGFLTEVEPEQIYPVLDRLMQDDYEIEERMNVKGTVYKETAYEEAKRRDPIIFGVIAGSKKLYYVADWIDEYCDLTLDAFVDALGIEKDDLHFDAEEIKKAKEQEKQENKAEEKPKKRNYKRKKKNNKN